MIGGVERAIVGFHADDMGDWVAELSCLHNQHVRHRPPFLERSWVVSEVERTAHLGSVIDCPLCDRAELPDDLAIARTAGPFDQASIPPALLKDHVVAERTWGDLRVLEGRMTFKMATDPPFERQLVGGDHQPIPPGIKHHLVLEGAVSFAIDFRIRGDPGP
ncbi:MAG: DUF3565 domain-containing protein [Acidimicrobiales bacterium]